MSEGNHIQMSTFGADHGYSDCITLTGILFVAVLFIAMQRNDTQLAGFRWFLQQETERNLAKMDYITVLKLSAFR